MAKDKNIDAKSATLQDNITSILNVSDEHEQDTCDTQSLKKQRCDICEIDFALEEIFDKHVNFVHAQDKVRGKSKTYDSNHSMIKND